jgi:hypothetical protein
VTLTTVAAFTAAGLALIGVVVNVFWGYRLSSRAQLEQWRRNEVRPIVARVLTLSEDARLQWAVAARLIRKWREALEAVKEDPSWGSEVTKVHEEASARLTAGRELYSKLRFETAQLDLFAGQAVRDVAHRLFNVHKGLNDRVRLEPEPISERYKPGSSFALLEEEMFPVEQGMIIDALHAELVEKTRADFGLTASDR